ncbi:beta-ketoacyl-ACP synthase III [Alkalibacter rhizosphaerae]|uniref:beta-ketoacyl-ACP synthase III n=1 Tax=Alkalibacter rhizosphaerae TaxID=2815577 RepID=UPI001FEE3D42|nr:beta-ketoacyl-ACP synthase III [Alkalibacter rhizosphaerae]
MKKSKIIAAGKAAAEHLITNEDLSQMVDTNDEWIQSRTGIQTRRVSLQETTLDLATRASLDALHKGDIDPETLDMIIVATVTPDYFIPACASLLQHRLGLNHRPMMAFDLNAACTGLIYAIQTAEKFIATGSAKRVLVVGSETLSRIVDWTDRGTCVLFGDGAGAVILEESDQEGILADYTNSRGDAELNLAMPAFPLDNPFQQESCSMTHQKMTMAGAEIFKFATFAIRDAMEELLSRSGLTMEDIDLIIPHQANARIIAKVARQMGLPMDKFFLNLSDYGNTSSASIGLALAEAMEQGRIHKGDHVILVGFGGGLTWGGILHRF